MSRAEGTDEGGGGALAGLERIAAFLHDERWKLQVGQQIADPGEGVRRDIEQRQWVVAVGVPARRHDKRLGLVRAHGFDQGSAGFEKGFVATAGSKRHVDVGTQPLALTALISIARKVRIVGRGIVCTDANSTSLRP